MTINTPISISLHLWMTLFVVLLVLGAVALGLWARQRANLVAVSKVLGWAMLLLWLLYNVYYFYPANFRWQTSLPLHVCDVLGPISTIVLISSNRYARAILYFCAIPLAGQAIITPTGNQDPGTVRFWLYWTLHAGIIAASFFDVIVRSYRPTFKDYVRTLSLGVAYVVLITPFNIVFGWNYGYVGKSKPDVATAIDFLGPWPARIFVLVLLVACVQAIMLAPWVVLRRNRAV